MRGIHIEEWKLLKIEISRSEGKEKKKNKYNFFEGIKIVVVLASSTFFSFSFSLFHLTSHVFSIPKYMCILLSPRQSKNAFFDCFRDSYRNHLFLDVSVILLKLYTNEKKNSVGKREMSRCLLAFFLELFQAKIGCNLKVSTVILVMIVLSAVRIQSENLFSYRVIPTVTKLSTHSDVVTSRKSFF